MKKKELKQELKQIGYIKVEFDNSNYNSLARTLNNIISWGARRNPMSLRFMYWDDVMDEYEQNKIIIKTTLSIEPELIEQNDIDAYNLAEKKVMIFESYFNLIELLESKDKEYKGVVEWVRE